MAYAKLENSPRLQRVKKLLDDGEKHDSQDIANNAYVNYAAGCIYELEKNGLEIRRTQVGKIHYYQLMMF